jgi:Mn-dependent DtxR family transcriptional regulator
MVAKPSPEAVLLFLKHAALDQEWTPSDIASPLGIDSATAKQIAEELALLGYAEAVPRKRDTWRNTAYRERGRARQTPAADAQER